jgi:hypothetical protein
MIAHAPSDHPNIGVRGAYTQAQIARLGLGDKVAVTGCPSNFITMHHDVAKTLAEGFAATPELVAVTAGIPYIPRLRALEHELAQLVTDTGGAYIVQHGKEMLHLAATSSTSSARSGWSCAGTTSGPSSTCPPSAPGAAGTRTRSSTLRPGWTSSSASTSWSAPASTARCWRCRSACRRGHRPRQPDVRDVHDDGRARCAWTPTSTGPLTRERLPELFPFDPDAFLDKRRTLHAAYSQILMDAQIDTVDPLKRMF